MFSVCKNAFWCTPTGGKVCSVCIGGAFCTRTGGKSQLFAIFVENQIAKMRRIVFIAAAALVMFSCGKENQKFRIGAVDIGLSVKWANANLGAEAPEGYGDSYAWGETQTKEVFSFASYHWYHLDGDNAPFLTKYNNSSYYGTVDNKVVLDAADDVAHVQLGGKWRMPTKREVEELISTQINDNYRWQLKFVNGQYGWMITYLVNKNAIFIPYGGKYIWSSSLDEEGPLSAYYVIFSESNIIGTYDERFRGHKVRPVSE